MTRASMVPGLALIATAALLPAAAIAAAATTAPPTVEWQLPVEPSWPAQTAAQDAFAMQHGRPLPEPEVLQPTLDRALAGFVPRYGADFTATLRVMGSDTMPALVRSWIRSFSHYYPRVRIVFGPPFEGTDAFKDLRAGRVDVAFVSRELKPTDVSAFEAQYHYAPTSVPVAGGSWRQFGYLDAVVVIVNPLNPLRQLSLKQLDAVFSRSHLRGDRAASTWGGLGAAGAWADRPIHVYGIQPWNGFEEFFRQRVLDARGQRGHWRAGMHFDRLVFPVARHVAEDPDAIGYTGLAFVDSPVKVLAVGQAGDEVSPTYINVALARYPLSRLVYANVNRRPGKALPPAVQEFLRLILSRQGQEDVRAEGIFLPLRQFQVRSAERIAGLSANGAR